MADSTRPKMRYGYWMPVFGGWLRNVEDEQMAATWDYVSRLARRSEKIGLDPPLIPDTARAAPARAAWSAPPAPPAVPERLQLMIPVPPRFHLPALPRKEAANIDN